MAHVALSETKGKVITFRKRRRPGAAWRCRIASARRQASSELCSPYLVGNPWLRMHQQRAIAMVSFDLNKFHLADRRNPPNSQMPNSNCRNNSGAPAPSCNGPIACDCCSKEGRQQPTKNIATNRTSSIQQNCVVSRVKKSTFSRSHKSLTIKKKKKTEKLPGRGTPAAPRPVLLL